MYVEVKGDFACFTMPEAKTERMSYPVITPSAARSMISAIFWKPEIRWIVRRIKLLRNVKYLTLKRNEVGKIPINVDNPINVSASKNRVQRVSTILKDVGYEIEIEPILTPKGTAGKVSLEKYEAILKRRLEIGQCFFPPYLGCREFIAFISLSDGKAKAVPVDMDLGLMFYDRYYPGDDTFTGITSPEQQAFFIPAKFNKGVIEIPDRKTVMGVYA